MRRKLSILIVTDTLNHSFLQHTCCLGKIFTIITWLRVFLFLCLSYIFYVFTVILYTAIYIFLRKNKRKIKRVYISHNSFKILYKNVYNIYKLFLNRLDLQRFVYSFIHTIFYIKNFLSLYTFSYSRHIHNGEKRGRGADWDTQS